MKGLDVGKRAMQFTFEAAPVRDIQQKVAIRRALQFVDSRLRPRQLGPEPADGRFGVIGRDRQSGRPKALRRSLARARAGFAVFRSSRGDWPGFLFHGHLKEALLEFTKTG